MCLLLLTVTLYLLCFVSPGAPVPGHLLLGSYPPELQYEDENEPRGARTDERRIPYHQRAIFLEDEDMITNMFGFSPRL